MASRPLAVITLVPLIILTASCGSTSSPTSPQPSVPACEKNHTATVSFHNTSNRITMDVLWDGSKVATVAPGQTSSDRTVNAGIHTLLFTVTNSSEMGCTPSTPNVAQCSTHTYSCAGPS